MKAEPVTTILPVPMHKRYLMALKSYNSQCYRSQLLKDALTPFVDEYERTKSTTITLPIEVMRNAQRVLRGIDTDVYA